ncbi:MAG: hypothetical protein RI910_910 [Verrucomicrobiota bacterium]|jgi:S1-C subfamily serine protease
MRIPSAVLLILVFGLRLLKAETTVWFEVKRETTQTFAAKRSDFRIPLYQYGQACARKTEAIAHVNIFVSSDGLGAEAELQKRIGEIQQTARQMGADAVMAAGRFIISKYHDSGAVKEVVWPVKLVRFTDEKPVDFRTEADFVKILDASTALNPIEGLWLDLSTGQRVAIIRDASLIGSFVGVQYHSPDEEARGLVTMRLSEMGAGTYGGKLMLDDYMELNARFSIGNGEITIVDRYDNNLTKPESVAKVAAPNFTVSEFKFKKLYPATGQAPRTPPGREVVPSPVEQKSPTTYGSGLICTTSGHFFTNHHVIAGAKKVFLVRYVNGELVSKLTAQVIMSDPKLDLAILRVEGWSPPAGQPNTPPALLSSSAVKLGDEVFVLGFPLPGLVSSNVKFTRGSISDTAGLADDISRIQHTAQIQPGNSGGPMALVDGRVVGVVVSTLRGDGMFRSAGVMPQGVNFSVKAEYVIQQFQKLGIDLPAFTPNANPIDHVKAYTVQIMAER